MKPIMKFQVLRRITLGHRRRYEIVHIRNRYGNYWWLVKDRAETSKRGFPTTIGQYKTEMEALTSVPW